MKTLRKIIQIDEEKCDGCGNCVISCAEGALAVIDGKARVISDNLCDGLGACLGECPQDALHIIEREAEDFDEEAVEAHLAARGTPDAGPHATSKPKETLPCGCPSATLETFGPCERANIPIARSGSPDSALSHWPVQIRLIPPNAPFLKNADLLVVADCVPVAFPALHRDFMQGRAVMLGCPKFDDAQSYVDRFAGIFKTAGIQSITTVVMEVPCCAGLPNIVKKGMEKAGKKIPFTQVVVSTRGRIMHERDVA
jgi:Pyruvate/2-oxoacid:ferredoxin oxidoreductase delta subunit